MTRTALVTGSAGFVGRRMVAALEARRYNVARVDVARGIDARDYFRSARERFDLVVHLAAVVGGRQMIEGAPLELAVDLAIDAELAQWALLTRPGRVVYYSSSAAYPLWRQTDDGWTLLAEHHVDLRSVEQPDAIYGWAKLTGERLMRELEVAGVPVTILRPFSGYAEDQAESYPFRALLERARRREDPFTIWGSGATVRDWIHIDDVIAGTLAAVDAGVSGPLNLCTGRATPFLELAELFHRAARYSPAIRIDAEAPRGVSYRVGDPTRMLEVYRPVIELEDAVARAFR